MMSREFLGVYSPIPPIIDVIHGSQKINAANVPLDAIFIKKETISDIRELIERNIGPSLAFSLVYGQSAQFTPSNYRGDIDILVVTHQDIPLKGKVGFIKALHSYYLEQGITIDEEVCPDRKLVISAERLNQIRFLRPFVDKNGRYGVRSIGNNDDKYLNSSAFLDRLFLNALTTKNLFLSGDQSTFEQYKEFSFGVLLNLIEMFNGAIISDAEKAVQILLPPQNLWYKDFLGYQNIEPVITHLTKNLAHAIESRQLSVVNSDSRDQFPMQS